MTENRPRLVSDEKFHKYEHILKSKDFGAVYKKGLRVKAGPLVLSYLPNGLVHNRLGFSVSSRNVKLASSRNRLKRLFREVYRRSKSRIKKSFDLVVIFRSNPAKSITFGEAETLFFKAIKSAGIAQ